MFLEPKMNDLHQKVEILVASKWKKKKRNEKKHDNINCESNQGK